MTHLIIWKKSARIPIYNPPKPKTILFLLFHEELTSKLYLRWFKKLFGIVQVSLDEEGHHSTKACHLFLSKLMLRKRFQTWKQDAFISRKFDDYSPSVQGYKKNNVNLCNIVTDCNCSILSFEGILTSLTDCQTVSCRYNSTIVQYFVTVLIYGVDTKEQKIENWEKKLNHVQLLLLKQHPLPLPLNIATLASPPWHTWIHDLLHPGVLLQKFCHSHSINLMLPHA